MVKLQCTGVQYSKPRRNSEQICTVRRTFQLDSNYNDNFVIANLPVGISDIAFSPI